MNILPGRVAFSDRGPIVEFDGGAVQLSHLPAVGTAVDIGLRPEHLTPCNEAEADLLVEVDVLEELGSDTLAICLLGQRELTVRVPADRAGALDRRQPLRFDRRNLHLFDGQSGQRINFDA
ncbi:MAG: transporter related [Cereibacter sp.]|jgi:sn-glycerol 3-phosphate transport system ATP-binding protein/multiple sugar transport system ATP-binding protein|nr:transporter related [Cereibacter sp.]